LLKKKWIFAVSYSKSKIFAVVKETHISSSHMQKLLLPESGLGISFPPTAVGKRNK